MNSGLARRIVVPRRGPPDVMRWTAETMPEPKDGEVRVRVQAAGVSAYDVMLRARWFPGFTSVPYTPGEDIVGIVDKVGRGVTGLHLGQRVGGWTFGDGGGYAEYLCRPETDLVPVPDGLDASVAVALIVNYLTASLALHQAANAKPGERVLIQGAGGGLGSALLQMGREAGLEMFGCDAVQKHDQIRADGATPIDYQGEDVVGQVREFTGKGADVVIDLIGGPRQLLRSYRALTIGHGGRLVMLGMAGSLQKGTAIILPSLAMTALLSVWPDGRRVVFGPGMESYPRDHPDWYRETLARFFALTLEGRLTPRVAERIPMAEAATAHALLEQGNVLGKIVLIASD